VEIFVGVLFGQQRLKIRNFLAVRLWIGARVLKAIHAASPSRLFIALEKKIRQIDEARILSALRSNVLLIRWNSHVSRIRL
jgi:hypothetical protein